MPSSFFILAPSTSTTCCQWVLILFIMCSFESLSMAFSTLVCYCIYNNYIRYLIQYLGDEDLFILQIRYNPINVGIYVVIFKYILVIEFSPNSGFVYIVLFLRTIISENIFVIIILFLFVCIRSSNLHLFFPSFSFFFPALTLVQYNISMFHIY